MSTVATTDEGLTSGLHLLAAGIPLTLLLDLAAGPRSAEAYQEEGGADLSWLRPAGPAAQRLAG
jgi:hypothetical protein